MFHIIPADQRFFANKDGWLATYHLFSFAEYYDPANLHWGQLRVCNIDTIAPHSGFGRHAHQNMEIVTLLRSGDLTHTDSLGNTAVLQAGQIQRMSAGSGVMHAELNDGDVPVELCQLWFFPNVLHIPPEYAQRSLSPQTDAGNDLPLLISPEGLADSMRLHADVSLRYGHLSAGTVCTRTHAPARAVFGYLFAGQVRVNDQLLEAGDQLRGRGETVYQIQVISDAELLWIDSPWPDLS